MKQIKTIVVRRGKTEEFDKEVNQALAQGWGLVRRYTDPGFAATESNMVFYPALVAELEKEDCPVERGLHREDAAPRYTVSQYALGSWLQSLGVSSIEELRAKLLDDGK